MGRKRIPETFTGIQEAFTVEMYDRMMRGMRDRGITGQQVRGILEAGITGGRVLEIGPGPGYLGLEWLRATGSGSVTVLDISPAMLEMVRKNAQEYGVAESYTFVAGNAMSLPFEEGAFDAVFSNGSLHEWELPQLVFAEIIRVLRPGGCLFVGDLKRNMFAPARWLMKKKVDPVAMLPGLVSSLDAAYTRAEAAVLVPARGLASVSVREHLFGLSISGVKCA